ncbi:Predicted metal-binding integral membrane protein [Ruegeria halocynthiae]|uniref:Predicted metal-binding integral membrane protein n=1 Tax=Ruegeria halocynthiae TaxID=985054 RepID=A0A1H3FTA2_9RHOB|nr:DUF2182 domain-containing protein [Ruegeria halocynthiae]SDX94292.1 Predicted metal-binding integral membrane protein [Ruegeria halocynthiae]
MTRYAAFGAQLSASSLPALFAISVSAYLALLLLPSGGALADLCGAISTSELGHLILTAPWLVSPGHIALDWGVMIIAMMTPLIAPILGYVRRSVSMDRKWGATIAFLGAYWAVWFASSLVLLPLVVALVTLTGDYADLPAAVLIALVFSASPMAQSARNACHHLCRITPFGPKAWIDSVRQGCDTGLRCIAVCWPWMLVPLTITTGHLTLMVIVGIFLFADRIAPPSRPRWQVPPAFETLLGPPMFRLGPNQLRKAR